MSENILVLGASSEIARALVHRLAARGCSLILAGRNEEELRRDAGDLQQRYGSPCHAARFEACDFDSHASMIQHAIDTFGGELAGIIACHGYLPDQNAAESSFTEAHKTVDVNFTSIVSSFTAASAYLQQRRSGFLAAISSVAGDRGRRSNYLYGSAKAGLTAYLQGLRQRLHKSGIHVLTIKPGFVDTVMTRGLIDPHSPMVTKPDRVARDIDRALRRRRNVIYTPWYWRPILGIVTAIPEAIFKRL